MQYEHYRQRISGPLFDRIDLYIEVPRVGTDALTELPQGERSESIRARVQAARDRQLARLQYTGLLTNAQATSELVTRLFKPTRDAEQILRKAIQQFRLSARSYFRLLKVSQTIADLAAQTEIAAEHVAEALQYRSFAQT